MLQLITATFREEKFRPEPEQYTELLDTRIQIRPDFRDKLIEQLKGTFGKYYDYHRRDIATNSHTLCCNLYSDRIKSAVLFQQTLSHNAHENNLEKTLQFPQNGMLQAEVLHHKLLSVFLFSCCFRSSFPRFILSPRH